MPVPGFGLFALSQGYETIKAARGARSYFGRSTDELRLSAGKPAKFARSSCHCDGKAAAAQKSQNPLQKEAVSVAGRDFVRYLTSREQNER